MAGRPAPPCMELKRIVSLPRDGMKRHGRAGDRLGRVVGAVGAMAGGWPHR